ncbi:hypothetical protein [Aurantivibrio plasticivorans]
MSDNNLAQKQTIAGASSLAIITAGIIYWAFQAHNCYEMLSLAYG